MRAGHIIPALGVHGEAVATLGESGILLIAKKKAGLGINGESLKLRAEHDGGIGRERVWSHEDEKFLVIGRLGKADGRRVEFRG